jgi:hypothetical protein
VEAIMLLCDYAEEVGGKLYIMGGGWSRLLRRTPVAMSVAVKLFIPWDEADATHKLSLSLVKEGGEAVVAEGNPVHLTGEVSVTRAPGLRHGTPIDLPFAVRFEAMALEPGWYEWKLHVDDSFVTQTSFEVLGEPATQEDTEKITQPA